MDPYRIAHHALGANLDGVVLAEHDVLWAEEERDVLAGAAPSLRIYRGIEVSAEECHLVVVGLDDAGALSRGVAVAQVAAVAAAQGAVVILAHPFRDSDPARLPLHLMDAIEVASTSFSRADTRRALSLARRLGKPAVAASDAHALTRIGWAWTEFTTLPENERRLAAAIRRGEGRPGTAAGSRLPTGGLAR